MKMVAVFTSIPLSIFSHAVVRRIKLSKGPSRKIHETTMELIQYITVQLHKPNDSYSAMTGDRHQCVLYCEKCSRVFGEKGTIFKVLAGG